MVIWYTYAISTDKAPALSQEWILKIGLFECILYTFNSPVLNL